jgi:hypothetical protein
MKNFTRAGDGKLIFHFPWPKVRYTNTIQTDPMIIVVQFSRSHAIAAKEISHTAAAIVILKNIASFIKNYPSKCCLLVVFRKYVHL